MIYLSTGTYKRLQQAFVSDDISLIVKSDNNYIVAESSKNQTEMKIRQIIEIAGFCPLISKYKMNNNFVFTITPYKIPEFFSDNNNNNNPSLQTPLSKLFESLSLSTNVKALKTIERNKSHYFNRDEISSLLKHRTYVCSQEDATPNDKWSKVNVLRPFFSSAFSQGLFEIISSSAIDDYPIVEIGSGIGYTLPRSLSSQTIRTQPSPSECQLLGRSISDPIYQMNIEDLYHCFLDTGKKIPLFFALNVFDTMSQDQRKTNLSQISQLQDTGDRMLIMLDTNPCLDVVINHLKTLYPNHAALPYLPLTKDCTKLSVVIVPLELVPFNRASFDCVAMLETSAQAVMDGHVSKIQYVLHQLQSMYHLKVIVLEDFFVEQVKNELEQIGYTQNVYYHAAYTTGDLPECLSGVQQDLIYKSVTDTSTMRQWSLEDKNLLKWLNEKNLKLPHHFNANFLSDLRKKNHKIFGAEILVIEATKN